VSDDILLKKAILLEDKREEIKETQQELLKIIPNIIVMIDENIKQGKKERKRKEIFLILAFVSLLVMPFLPIIIFNLLFRTP